MQNRTQTRKAYIIGAQHGIADAQCAAYLYGMTNRAHDFAVEIGDENIECRAGVVDALPKWMLEHYENGKAAGRSWLFTQTHERALEGRASVAYLLTLFAIDNGLADDLLNAKLEPERQVQPKYSVPTWWVVARVDSWFARLIYWLPRWSGVVVETARVGQDYQSFVRIGFARKLNSNGNIL